MKTILITVYLLQGGALQGSPWQTFSSFEACEKRAAELRTAIKGDRILFAIGCLNHELLTEYTAFHFQLKYVDPQNIDQDQKPH